MQLRSRELAILGLIVAIFLCLPFAPPARTEQTLEPTLVTVLNTLGYTNISLSSAQTFPAGTYEVKLLAEFAGYHATNNFSYYPVGTSNFALIFSGPEGNEGYVTPPIVKTFSCNTPLGFSMYVASESHRYFTETSLNPDGLQHAQVYQNLDDPDMYFIGFENMYGCEADKDFQDMVVSIEPIEHYLTVQTQPPGVTTIPGEGWYPEGMDVELMAPDTVPVSIGVRYNFSHWVIDDTLKEPGVDPITVHMDANHTATAHYTLQYHLTVTSPYGTTGGEAWYDSGSTAYATLDTGTVNCGNGTRRVFTSWNGDASGTNYAQSDPILMDGPKTAVALWKTQYNLTVTSPYGTPYGGGWYDNGATANASLDVGSVNCGNGTSRVFTSWTMDASGTDYAQSDPIVMDAPKTAVAYWKTQYYLTVTTNPGSITTPSGEGWYDAGTDASISTLEHINIVSGSSRYKFNGWTTADMSEIANPSSPSTTVLMDQPKTVTANYKTQYYLTITHTADGETDLASSWFDAGENPNVTAIPNLGYKLERWELDDKDEGSANPFNVTMNKAHTLHAVFEPIVGGSTAAIELHLTPAWVCISTILTAAFCVAALYAKHLRRKA